MAYGRTVIVGLLGWLALSSPAAALCTSYPNPLSNGTVADGGQVMANFNCAALTSGSTLNGITITGTTTLPGSSAISSTGALGLGMTPVNILDITKNQNATSSVKLLNNSTGTAAQANFLLNNGTATGAVALYGTGFTSTGQFRQNGLILYTDGSGGITIDTNASAAIIFATSATERGRFGTDGSYLVGTTTNGGWSANAKIAAVSSNAVAVSAQNTGTTGGSAINARVESTTPALETFYYTSTKVGSITTNSTSTTYNTTSDERLKNWAIPQRDYKAAIRSLWVGDFTWKANGKSDFGIRAQQAYSLYPSAIHKPAIASGEWQADYGKLAPLALWGVKDLYKSSDNQDARISALEHQMSALRQVNAADKAEIRQLKAQISMANDNQTQINRLLVQVSELQKRVGIRTAQR